MRANWSGRRVGSGLALVALVGGIFAAQLGGEPNAGHDWVGHDWVRSVTPIVVDAPGASQTFTVEP